MITEREIVQLRRCEDCSVKLLEESPDRRRISALEKLLMKKGVLTMAYIPRRDEWELIGSDGFRVTSEYSFGEFLDEILEKTHEQ